MTHLFTLSLFGGFHVTTNGRPITNFRTDKVRALLAYLVVEAERPQRRETVAAFLWPDQPQATSLMNLRQSLYRLRRAIGDKKAKQPLLRITRVALQWNFTNQEHCWVDVMKFNSLLQEVRLHSHEDLASCSSCLTRYQQAVSFYHGPLLSGFSLSDSEPFDSWLRVQQDFFHQQVLQVLYELTEAYEQKQEFELAQQYAQQQIFLEPWREVASQQLMRVLAKNGQRAAALAQYEECTRVMAQELGTSVSLNTTILYEQIRDGLFPRATDMAHLASRHTLPMPLTPFIGRQNELKQLQDHIKVYRVLTLLGQGGIGKSRLALHFATSQLDHFTHGVYLASLAKVNSAELLISTIATALNFSFDRQDDAKQQLLDYLRKREMLLIVDNAEHLDSGVSFLLELLAHAPQIKLVITTRRTFHLPEQVILPIEGFPLPDEHATSTNNSAIQLFQQRAREIGHIMLEDDLPCIRRICCLVGGMPLAIELVASWVRLFSCQEIAQDMLPHSDFLRRTATQHEHPTLRPVFNQAWARLSPSEKYVLRKLSVFTDDFDECAAEQVAGASRLILQSLSDKLFFRDNEFTTHENKRYRMHDTIQEYTTNKLDEVPQEVNDTRNRHSDYYALFLRERTKALTGSGQEKMLNEINIELQNIRAAWEWAVSKKRVNTIANALQGLFSFYDLRSWFQEGIAAFKRASEQLSTILYNDQSYFVYSQLLSRQAWFAFHLGDQLLAKTLLKESLARVRVIGDENELLFALNHLAIVHYHLGEYDYAQKISKECLQIAQKRRNDYYIARACNTLGQLAYQLDQHREAKRYYKQSLDRAIQVGDRSTEAFAMTYLGEIAYLLAQLSEAKSLFEGSLQIREKIKDSRGVASCYISLGDIASAERNYLEAQELYTKSKKIFHDIGNQLGITNVLIKQGQLLVTQNLEKQAGVCFQQALELALKSGTTPQLLLIFNELVNLLSEANELEWANELLTFTQSQPNQIGRCIPIANRLIKWLNETLPRLSVFSTEN